MKKITPHWSRTKRSPAGPRCHPPPVERLTAQGHALCMRPRVTSHYVVKISVVKYLGMVYPRYIHKCHSAMVGNKTFSCGT